MFNKPNILVCSDFSDYSNLALKAADRFKTETHGSLHVLHVAEVPIQWDWMPGDGFSKNVTENKEVQYIERLSKNLNEQMKACHIDGERHVAMGIPSTVIIEEIITNKIDLVVIGHKGKSAGVFHLGSLAEKIVASSPVPVLVVKEHFETNKIAALVDPNGKMEQIIPTAEEMAYLFSSQLVIISLFPDLAARFIGLGKLGFSTELLTLSKDQKEEISKKIRNRIHEQITKYSDAKVIMEFSIEKKLAYHLNSILNEHQISMAILQRHQSYFLEKIIIGSETRRMLEIFKGNLLVLPPRD